MCQLISVNVIVSVWNFLEYVNVYLPAVLSNKIIRIKCLEGHETEFVI